MFRGAIVFGFLTFASTAFALDPFAWQEVQRQVDQVQTERMYWSSTVTEADRTTNRYDTNSDRPLRGARTIAGGPPRIIQAQKPIRYQPARYKTKPQVGGIVAHLRGSTGRGGNFGRIFSGGGSPNFNFHGLAEGAKPFSFGLGK
jgi:hypothetical protein